jgi:hypothetical protein
MPGLTWTRLARTAKRVVDKRGGVEALKADAEEIKKIAKSDASFGTKAGAAVKAIKDAGARNEEPAGTAEQPAGTAEQPAGTAEQPAGTAEQPAGTAEQPAGTAAEPEPTSATEPPPGPTAGPPGS